MFGMSPHQWQWFTADIAWTDIGLLGLERQASKKKQHPCHEQTAEKLNELL